MTLEIKCKLVKPPELHLFANGGVYFGDQSGHGAPGMMNLISCDVTLCDMQMLDWTRFMSLDVLPAIAVHFGLSIVIKPHWQK